LKRAAIASTGTILLTLFRKRLHMPVSSVIEMYRP
jgi:hypothetical protein